MKTFQHKAAVSCILNGYMSGGVGLWFWMTGKLGRAWWRCMVVPGVVHGWCVRWGFGNCMCIHIKTT